MIISIALVVACAGADEPALRVSQILKTKGVLALCDFVLREDGRFAAHQNSEEKADLRLDVTNYVLDDWGEGQPAVAADFPLGGRGPFGEAVQFRAEKDPTFRPVLLVARARLHIQASMPRSVTLPASS